MPTEKEIENVMKRAEEYKKNGESHTDGYGSADDLIVLYEEVLHLREKLKAHDLL